MVEKRENPIISILILGSEKEEMEKRVWGHSQNFCLSSFAALTGFCPDDQASSPWEPATQHATTALLKSRAVEPAH